MDSIEKMILQGGYINNNSLHRRYIMTQMLRHLENFDDYFIHHKPYDYTWSTTLNELRMQCNCNSKEQKLRFKLFGKNTVIDMLKGYKDQMMKTYNNKFDQTRINKTIENAKKSTNSVQLYRVVDEFMKRNTTKIKCVKSNAWIASFKSIGAYYTMDSLIKLYDCTCIRLDEDIRQMSTDEALSWLDNWSSKPTELFDVMLDFLNINKLNIDKLLCYS